MRRFWNVFLLLAVAGFAPAAHADLILNSFDDPQLPSPDLNETVVGFTTADGLELSTTTKLYTYSGQDGSLTVSFTLEWGLQIHLAADTLVASNPADPSQLFMTATPPRGGNPLLYTITIIPAPGQTQDMTDTSSSFGPPSATGLAADSTGAVYLAVGSQIEKFTNSTDASPSLTFNATSYGTLSSPGALAFGPDKNLYVLDTGNNRIAIFDTNGNPLGSIVLTPGSYDPTALAIGANGWLYTANGNGGGSIFDIYTGQQIGSLASSGEGPTTLDKAVLAVGGDDIYLYDASTGLHVFDDGAETPEPASWGLFGIGLVGMMLWRRMDTRL